ncbi:uncharacterized protein LOC120458252 [Drosophila santomea]|uniref:uncharacterized protein LOC120458252 n=1 Tax=Drosophila santomea TaxID=129105 RepID=UPI001954E3C1|nr:uncharacterized protein LOC120458252 [Drosophila santomea]
METKLMVITFLIVYVLAQTKADCVSKPIVDGKCDQRIKGYTYVVAENQCKRFKTRGCTVGGNYYRTLEECISKCNGFFQWEDIGFSGKRYWPPSEIDDPWSNDSEESEVETISKRGSKKQDPPMVLNPDLYYNQFIEPPIAVNQFMGIAPTPYAPQ